MDLRLNKPLTMERVSGEILYRQVREMPLTYLPVADSEFFRENTSVDAVQGWTAPLTPDEAAAVAAYRRKECRWLDAVQRIGPSAASVMGRTQYEKVRMLESSLVSAVSKSLTFGLLLRHYLRERPAVLPGEAPLKGRVYVLRGPVSCSLTDRTVPGYSSVELRIASPPGLGRGVFVNPDGAPLEDMEFVLPPGTTLRIAGCCGSVIAAEIVRPLASEWVHAHEEPPDRICREDTHAKSYNEKMIGEFRTSDRCPNVPDIAPAPTLGW